MIRIGIGCLFFATAGFCEVDQASAEDESWDVATLEKILDEALEEISSRRLNLREERRFKRKVVATWSAAEIDRLLESWTKADAEEKGYFYWSNVMEERFAFFDHKPMIEGLMGMNTYLGELAELAGQGLDSNSAESSLRLHFRDLEAAMTGWSRRDPKAAWRAVNHSEGELAGFALLENYGYLLPRTIFKHLARVDPGEAIAEFKKHPDTLYRESMLVGLSRGLPEGFDWKSLFDEILASLEEDEKWLHRRLRENLLARWMQDDADAAMKWFRSEAGQEISLRDEIVDEIKQGEEEYTVESTVSYWWIRDSAGAEQWLRKNPAVLRGLLRGSEFEGTDPLYPDDLRDILRAVRDPAGRGQLLKDLRKKGKLSRVLSDGGRELLRSELQQLEIENELEEVLLKARLAEE